MKKTLLTIGIGAGLMYLFDPQHGSSRRSRLLDKIQGVLPKTTEAVNSKVNALGSKASEFTTRADDLAADAVTTMPPQIPTETADANGTGIVDASEIQPAS